MDKKMNELEENKNKKFGEESKTDMELKMGDIRIGFERIRSEEVEVKKDTQQKPLN